VGPMRQLRAWRVAGPGLLGPPHTNPTRSLCHPPRLLLLLLLSTRAAGGKAGGKTRISERGRSGSRRLLLK